DCEPPKGKKNEKVRQVLSVNTIRSIRFGRVVQRLAVRKDIRLGQFVEPVDEKLNDEYEQEYRRDLEEAGKVDAISVARPEPCDERGGDRAAGGAGDHLY